MNDRQRALLSEFSEAIDPAYCEPLIGLAEYAAELGYMPVRCKTQDLSIDFRSSRTKKNIMKLEASEQPHDGFRYGERNKPGLRLKFYASDSYSEIFSNGIKRVIEAFGGRYTGCYGCGRCDGTQGYTYTYPDGRKVYRCGGELVCIFDYEDHIDEVKELLRRQAELFALKSEEQV